MTAAQDLAVLLCVLVTTGLLRSSRIAEIQRNVYFSAVNSMVRRLLTLEAALGVTVLSLVLQLVWPAAKEWLNRPHPGVQVVVEDEQLRYLFYLPQEFDPKKSWPLLIFLHGAGERGYDPEVLKRCGPAAQVEQGLHYPFIIASPQCEPGSGWRADHVRRLLDRLEEQYHIDRCYLTGYSMGGYGAWSAAAEMPERFSAIAPLCGGGDTELAAQLAKTPTWAFHGEDDKVIPLENQQKLVDAVNKAGGTAKLTVYPSTGHAISQQTYANQDLYAWFLSHQ